MAKSRDWLYNLIKQYANKLTSLELDWLRELADYIIDNGLDKLNLTNLLAKISELLKRDFKHLRKIFKNLFDALDNEVIRDALKYLNIPLNETLFNSLKYLNAEHIRYTLSKLYGDAIREWSSILKNASEAVVKMYQWAMARYQSGTRLADAVQEAMASEAMRMFTVSDSLGRKWDLKSYFEMLIRTEGARMARELRNDILKKFNHDLVIITILSDSCKLCYPWEGKIVSISGTSTEYPALQTAIDEGYSHPNCRHDENAYIEGQSVPEKQSKEETEKLAAERERQRYLERNIRKWKKLLASSTTPASTAYYKSKVREWQKIFRDFLDSTGRKRFPGRQ